MSCVAGEDRELHCFPLFYQITLKIVMTLQEVTDQAEKWKDLSKLFLFITLVIAQTYQLAGYKDRFYKHVKTVNDVPITI